MDIRVATWNVRSLYRTGGVRLLTDELKKNKIAFAAVQETRFNNSTPIYRSNGYYIYPSSKSTNHVLGTAFFVAQEWNHLVIDFKPIDERMCVLRIKGRFKNYSLLNAHAPTNDSEDEEKELFYEALSRAYNNCQNHDIKILLGDMNAKVGREEVFRPTIGKWSLHDETNENGLRLVDFATEKGMVIKGTFFRRKQIHLATWKSPDGVTRNQIDHCLVDGRHFSDVINVRVSRKANVDSDHFLVVVVVRAHLSRAQTTRSQATRRFAISKLKNPEMAAAYAQEVSTGINQLRQQDPDVDLTTRWQGLSQVLRDKAASTIGYDSMNSRNTWFDDECAQVTDVKNEARESYLQRKTRAAQAKYERLRKIEKRLHRRKKREFQNRTLEELESARNTNETRKFYKILNAHRRDFNPRNDFCRSLDGTLLTNKTDVLARWSEHFDALLNEGAEQASTQDLEFLTERNSSVTEPTRQEVIDAINDLKNNKAPGPDGIPAELLKNGGSELIDILHEMVIEIWRTESLPDEWLKGLLCPIHKKGDKLDCKNFRGICVLCPAYKVFAKILYNRLLPHAESMIGDYQCGFRRDRSTTDQIFNVRLIQQKGKEFNIPTFHLFIDFQLAYDKINRRELLVGMNELGFEPKLIRLVNATLNGSKCQVKLGNESSNPFEVKVGLKQGDALSTLLFNVTLEVAMRRAGIQSSRTLATSMSQILAFADDLDIVGRTHSSVVEVFSSLKRETAKFGLVINENKTKYMKPTRATVPQQQANKVTIGDSEFEVVDEFIYLGVLVRADNDISLEIKRRIMAANRCFHSLQKHLRSKLLTIKTKLTIYKTLIRPVLLYGSESWPLTKTDENLLLSFERKVLRTIFGGKLENGSWRRRYNSELEKDFAEPNVVATVKLNRLRWAGHLARMDPNRAPAKLFSNDPEGRRGVGRPKKRWIDCVEADLKELRTSRWRTLAQDRQAWNNLLDQAKSRKWM